MPPTTLVVHYHRFGGDYDGWELWAWDRATETNGRGVPPTRRDAFGLVFELDPTTVGGPAIGLLPRRGAWEAKDPPDRCWYTGQPRELWLRQGVAEPAVTAPDTAPALLEARLRSWDALRLILSGPPGEPAESLAAGAGFLDAPTAPRVAALAPTGAVHGLPTFDVRLQRPLDPEADAPWALRFGLPGHAPVHLTMDELLDDDAFVSEAPCGALWTPEATLFRVFAPTATALRVSLYRSATGGRARRVVLERRPRGLWEGQAPGNLDGFYYTLSVAGLDPRLGRRAEVIDPWARATSGHAGRGVIVGDLPPPAPAPRGAPADAILYELHLRDFTIDPDSGIAARGRYLGAVETGTRLAGEPDVATGIDHLVELGVNAVQILPVADFENDEESPAYNWGYMPVHFGAPDGWYAGDRAGAARVRELREMVDAFHRRGLRVVLDVVVNHTAEKAPEKIYSFEGIVPGYYYRRWPDGTPANGSACGNEFRSEAPMARRFLLAMLERWVRDYGVDGFRFDLMGLVDVETLAEAARRLRALNPGILLYGEPWAAGPSPAPVTGRGAQRGRGFGLFDDLYRDAIKGGVFDATPGFIQGGARDAEIRAGLGDGLLEFAASPLEVVRFAECHDNATLFDRLVKTTTGRGDVNDADRLAMQRLAGALVLLAPGLPFLHAGQEMARTKGGDENSYRSPDAVNAIRWRWKREHAELVDYHRGLIALRRAHPLLRPADAEALRRHRRWLEELTGEPARPGLVAQVIARGDSGDAWEAACLLFSAAAEPAEVALPPGAWRVYVRGSRAADAPLVAGPLTGRVVVPPRSALVVAR